MNKKTRRYLFLLMSFLLAFNYCGCQPAGQTSGNPGTTFTPPPPSPTQPPVTREPSRTAAMLQRTASTLSPTSSPIPTQTPQPIGPDKFPEGINPLSGLPVQDAELLLLPPALVSISNSPLETRPQAGLSSSPLVFEIYIGVGVSRYLAVFYGEFPKLVPGSTRDVDFGMDEAAVGPIRSGRLPYEKLRQIYNGFLVFASASHRVLPYLDEYYIFYREDLDNYNLALLPIDRLREMAAEMYQNHSKRALFGNRFDSTIPTGGKEALSLWIPFHDLDQVVWQFDPASGSYQRYQDREDGVTFELMTDRLTGEPLSFENIVILLADYTFYDATLFDIELMYLNRYPALLFRDGKMQEIFWSTGNEEFEASTGFLRPIRFRDQEGQPVPLKHGQTWVEIIPRNSPYYEIAASGDYSKLSTTAKPESGHWLVLFQQPPFPLNPEEVNDGE